MKTRLLLLAAARSCGSLQQHRWRTVPLGAETLRDGAEALTSGAAVFLLSEVATEEECSIIATACCEPNSVSVTRRTAVNYRRRTWTMTTPRKIAIFQLGHIIVPGLGDDSR